MKPKNFRKVSCHPCGVSRTQTRSNVILGALIPALIRKVLRKTGFSHCFCKITNSHSFAGLFLCALSQGFLPCAFGGAFSRGFYRGQFSPGAFLQGLLLCALVRKLFFYAHFQDVVLPTWEETLQNFFSSFMMRKFDISFRGNPFTRSKFTQWHLKFLQLFFSWVGKYIKCRNTSAAKNHLKDLRDYSWLSHRHSVNQSLER